ncbi:hypothetical protein ACWEJ6_51825 [Nonomuraea sp. NPDC004702]
MAKHGGKGRTDRPYNDDEDSGKAGSTGDGLPQSPGGTHSKDKDQDDK